ncbi:MAG: hypothetical protein B7Z15_05895 [Rhizobiales bacterium 32-66-8]|nr:MAG: hypothetical protein B7Z15_05895 [Rhizobiales bacterium 32-66-8]
MCLIGKSRAYGNLGEGKLLMVAAPSSAALLAGSVGGAFAALLAILVIGALTGFGPERLLLAGIALGAMSLALLTLVLASGDPRTFLLLTWMSGATDRVGAGEAGILALCALLLMLPLPFLARWIDILPLGGSVSRALGVPLLASRLALCLSAAAMTAVAPTALGRTLAFPYQIPVGLFASLVGGPYLIWLLNRGDRG